MTASLTTSIAPRGRTRALPCGEDGSAAIAADPPPPAQDVSQPGRAARHRETAIGLGAVTAAMGLWWWATQTVRPQRMTDLGLVSVFPVPFVLAIGLLAATFVTLNVRRRSPEWLLAVVLVAIIVAIHGFAPVAYGTLRYSWAWKHLGVIDFIDRTGTVDRDSRYLDAYHNWPGFFAGSAFITSLTGARDAMELARWAPIFFQLWWSTAVLFTVSTFTHDRRLAWSATFLFAITAWIGQDYFSPQAMVYPLHLILLTVTVRWFGLAKGSAAQDGLRFEAPRRRRQALGVFVFLGSLSAVIVSSHQLTPFMTLASLAVLIVFRLNRGRMVLLVLAAQLAGWLVVVAGSYLSRNVVDEVSSIGSPVGNTRSTLIDTGRASDGQAIVAWMGRAEIVLIGLLAILGLAVRWRGGLRDYVPMALWVAPFLPLAANSYGGEMLFRSYLFALPFLCFFAASFLSSWGRWPALRPAAHIAAALVLVTGFLFAHFGKDRGYYFTRDEVAAARLVYENAPPGSLLIEGNRNYPGLFVNYDRFTYVPIDREPAETATEMIADPTAVISEWLSDPDHSVAYVISTRSMKAEIAAFGKLDVTMLDRLEASLLASPEFTVLYDTPDAKVFVLVKPGAVVPVAAGETAAPGPAKPS